MSVNFSKHAKPYLAKSSFGTILFFQDLIANDPLGKWSSFLSPTELRFIYDMISSSNSYRNFTLTTAQSQWLVKLLSKVKLHLPPSLPLATSPPDCSCKNAPAKKTKKVKKRKNKRAIAPHRDPAKTMV